MTTLKRGMVIDVNLDPTLGSETGKIRPCVVVTNDVYNERVPVIQVVPLTGWSEKKGRVRTNITIEPTKENGLNMKSVAVCLQTRPIDHQHRMVKVRGELSEGDMGQIDGALKIIFSLK
jgi:mRNA interferase MazF